MAPKVSTKARTELERREKAAVAADRALRDRLEAHRKATAKFVVDEADLRGKLDEANEAITKARPAAEEEQKKADAIERAEEEKANA